MDGHDNGCDEAKEYYQKIFERELCEAKQQWKGNSANEYSEDIAEEYEEPEVDDEWSSYVQKRDSKQAESREWFED